MFKIICNPYIHRILTPLHNIQRLSSYNKNKSLKYPSKVPKKCVEIKTPSTNEVCQIDEPTIQLLEQLSLVECANKEGIKTLEDAIQFADRILHINTDNVKPMYTVLNDRYLPLRDDKVTDGGIQKDILSNASVTEEEYFVAPPGNIPLEPRINLLYQDITSQKCKQ